MKPILTLMSLLITMFSINFDCKGAIITAITDGASWSNVTAWDLGRAPSCGDTIIVPAGIDLRITTTVDLDNGDPLCGAVRISISGSIAFSNGRKMRLATGACMSVENGGRVRQSFTGGGSSESITIGGEEVWKAGDGNLVGSATMGCPVVLPVTLVSFVINQDLESYSILWKVAQEKDLAFYQLFVSENGYNWESINTQTGAGTTTTEQNYQYRYIRNANENVQLYFKLQSTDLNGKVNVLAIETVKIDLSKILNENEITIYPNPSVSNNIVNVAFETITSDEIVIEIVDFTGKVILQKFESVEKGQNSILLETKDLIKGNYLVNVKSNQFNLNKKLTVI